MRIIGGHYRGKKLRGPPAGGTRPTADRTREMIFNVLLHNPAFGPKPLSDQSVLDIFAGTGALGLEAFSRGAQSVVFIENHRAVLPILYANVKALGLSHTCVLAQDALKILTPPALPFTLVFLDPPYHQDLSLPILARLSTHGWLAKEAIIIIETAKDESLLIPPFLSLVTERTSGAAKVLFLINDL